MYHTCLAIITHVNDWNSCMLQQHLNICCAKITWISLTALRMLLLTLDSRSDGKERKKKRQWWWRYPEKEKIISYLSFLLVQKQVQTFSDFFFSLFVLHGQKQEKEEKLMCIQLNWNWKYYLVCKTKNLVIGAFV